MNAAKIVMTMLDDKNNVVKEIYELYLTSTIFYRDDIFAIVLK